MRTVRARRGVKAALAFPTVINRFCMASLYGRAGCLTSQNGGLWPGQEEELAAAEFESALASAGACEEGPSGASAHDSGAALAQFHTTEDGWSCSTCGVVLAAGSTMFGNRASDVDLCEPCYKLTNPSLLVPSTPTPALLPPGSSAEHLCVCCVRVLCAPMLCVCGVCVYVCCLCLP